MTPTIILDFDGTVAIGTGPIEAFAREVSTATGDADFADAALAAVAAFERGDRAARDGYDVVGSMALERGADPAVLEAAYQASRALLGTPAAPVSMPSGLAEFLGGLRDRARIVLATNAPGAGILPLLGGWGVADAFTDLHFTVGKPAGLERIVRDALAGGAVLSVGDIAEFDLVPAAALGADTALVGATAKRSPAAVTMRARTLPDLYADIEQWVADASRRSPDPAFPTR